MNKIFEYIIYNYKLGGIRTSFLFILKNSFSLLRALYYKAFGLKGNISIIGCNCRIDSPSSTMFIGLNKLGENVKIIGRSINVNKIGPNVSIGDNSIIYLSNKESSFGKGLEIGANSTCAEYCIFGAAGGIKIGDDVIMGQYVRFHSENHIFTDKHKPIREQGVSRKGIIVQNNVWIGSGAVILDGVEIKTGCIIGANSLVTRSTEEYGIYAGSPAKLIKKR